MSREIGGEFWEMETWEKGSSIERESLCFLLSGRTCIDFLVKDIALCHRLESVYLPSYCCHSMIQPFLDNAVNAEFYGVDLSDGVFAYGLDPLNNCDAVLIMQYFGFCNPEVEEKIRCLKEQGKIVIEDATHSWFSKVPYCSLSDYVFVSLRKWTGLPAGALLLKQSGDFQIAAPWETNLNYIRMREQAAERKRRYLRGESVDKASFLNLFAQAEALLEKDYRGYGLPDDIMERISFLDSGRIAGRRRSNAALLIDSLKDFHCLEMPLLTSGDVPLFVPVFLHEKRRNELRQYLIERAIYCPVHWPASPASPGQSSSLFSRELSLVCDQRYSEAEMERIAGFVRDFLEDEK